MSLKNRKVKNILMPPFLYRKMIDCEYETIVECRNDFIEKYRFYLFKINVLKIRFDM